MTGLRIDHYLWLGLWCLVLVMMGWQSSTQVDSSTDVLPPAVAFDELTVAPVPVLQNQHEVQVFLATFSAQSIIVVDVPSGAPLLEKQADSPRALASTTKLMTAWVARRSFDLTAQIEVATASVEGRVIGLAPQQRVTVGDALGVLLINSANDAAYALANAYPGGQGAFVAAMNNQARLLGLEHSRFSNPAGLDDAQQYASARDLAYLTLQVMTDPVIRRLVNLRTYQFELADGSVVTVENTNQLLGKIPGVTGVKTGTTQGAGEVLVTRWQDGGRDIILVVMGGENRFAETEALLAWVRTNYRWWQPGENMP